MQLTTEQRSWLDNYQKEIKSLALSTDPLDRPKAIETVNALYAHVGVSAPRIEFYISPYAFRKAHPDIDINLAFGGNHRFYWIAVYHASEQLGSVYKPEHSATLKLWYAQIKYLHWWIPLDDVCYIIERPASISVNDQNQMHNDGGPSIAYRDGTAAYHLNNIEVPPDLALTPAEQLDMSLFHNAPSADVKAEFVRKYGVERMLNLGKKLDSYSNYSHEWWTKSQYELWDMAVLFEGLDYQPYLKMLNQTTGIWHVEAVSPECRTLEAAIKERFGGRDLKIVGVM